MLLTKKQLAILIESYLSEGYVNPSGVVTKNIQNKLDSLSKGADSNYIRPGQKSEFVRELQELLLKLGYQLPKYGADGDFGSETVRAVQKFQTETEISDDGVIGPDTASKLLDVVAKTKNYLNIQFVQPDVVIDPHVTDEKPRYDVENIDLSKYDVTIAKRKDPLFVFDGGESDMTKSSAEQDIIKTLEMYKEMVALLPFDVPIIDAIAKDGTSRERNRKGSQHFHGKALDLRVRYLSDEQKHELVKAASTVGFTSMGLGERSLHIDWRSDKAYWPYTSTYGGIRTSKIGRWIKKGGVYGSMPYPGDENNKNISE